MISLEYSTCASHSVLSGQCGLTVFAAATTVVAFVETKPNLIAY